MREIKFRAWYDNSINPRMIYFGLFDTDEGYYIRESVSLDGCPIMQYTGLKENVFEDVLKNKEIYEGDIIEFIDGKRLVVEWNDDTCQFQYSDGSPINSGERYATHKAIVGNICENPNLIKQPN